MVFQFLTRFSPCFPWAALAGYLLLHCILTRYTLYTHALGILRTALAGYLYVCVYSVDSVELYPVVPRFVFLPAVL